MGSLLQSIAEAFNEVPYPGDNNLTVYDPAGREFDETWQLLRGTRWQDFPVEAFMRGDTPIPDLTAVAFHYYMPALLTAALDVDDNSDVGGSLTFFLSPSSAINVDGPSFTHYDHRKEFHERLALFSTKQREVMIQVLKELAERWWGDESVADAIVVWRSNDAPDRTT
ncbi:MAG: DUF6714 family protein [Planctomycetota bacterium]